MTALFDLPYRRAAEAVRAAPLVWLLVNPVEYHGPHLPLHTDHLLSTAWVGALHRALGLPGDPLVARDLDLGVDPTVGPGSRAASYGEVRRAVIRACAGLRELGADAIAVVTFHGAPLHNLALASAVRWCEARGIRAVAPFQEVIRQLGADVPLFDRVAEQVPADRRAEVRASLAGDFHAGLLETSLMLRWHPDAVWPGHRDLPPCPPVRPWGLLARLARLAGRGPLGSELAAAAVGAGWMRLRPFPGYTGHPALASPEIGALFAEAVVEGVTPVVRDVLAGARRAPPPPFRWVGPLSLWGRLRP